MNHGDEMAVGGTASRPEWTLLVMMMVGFGMAACQEGGGPINGPPLDSDGDGWPDDADCAPDDVRARPEAIERCDGVDNDCNGVVDDDPLDQCCEPGTTSLCPEYRDSDCTAAQQARRMCGEDRRWEACVFSPPGELCGDGLDNDCDGVIDNSAICDCMVWGSCGGLCVDNEYCENENGAPGRMQGCETSEPYCRVDEICDSLDNDGDGEVDEGTGECAYGEERTCLGSCGVQGKKRCDSTCAWSERCELDEEVCDGIDNDCDGQIDQATAPGIACQPGTAAGCTTADGDEGFRRCTPACIWEPICEVIAVPEVCDGLDNNGNDQADEGFICRVGAERGCSDPWGDSGAQVCLAFCMWSACVAGLSPVVE